MKIALVIVVAIAVLLLQLMLSRARPSWLGSVLPLAGLLALTMAGLLGALHGLQDVVPLGVGVLALFGVWLRERSRMSD